MTTAEIINQMEKEFNRKVDTNKMNLFPSIRTILESFGEEIINVVNIGSESNTGTYLVAVRKFRKLQRLKVKEILSNLK